MFREFRFCETQDKCLRNEAADERRVMKASDDPDTLSGSRCLFIEGVCVCVYVCVKMSYSGGSNTPVCCHRDKVLGFIFNSALFGIFFIDVELNIFVSVPEI